jgi:hypothetical protein
MTVPYQLVELELFKLVQFIWTRVENQFISFELELDISSVHWIELFEQLRPLEPLTNY